MLSEIKNKLYSSDIFKRFATELKNNNLFLSGINGSLLSFIIDNSFNLLNKKIIYISNDSENIIKVKDDLDFISECENISYFNKEKHIDNEEFTKSLNYLSDENEFIVLVNSDSLNEKLISKNKYRDSLIELKKNDEYLFEELLQKLEEYNFEKNDFVEKTGDYSVRGGIIDLFPEYFDSPVRIEFLGETIESIREFDITTQRSLKEIENIKIGINLTDTKSEEIPDDYETILNYISENSLIFVDEPEFIKDEEKLNTLFQFLKNKKFIFISKLSSSEYIKEFSLSAIRYNSFPQPDFHSNLKMLYSNITENLKNDFEIQILCSDSYQADRIKSLMEDFEDAEFTGEETKLSESIKNKITYLPDSVQTGFIFPDSKIILYTEHQIFGRYFRQMKRSRKKFRGMTFEEVKELHYGDFVVHRDFGIGVFSGLNKIKIGKSEQEVVKLSYAGNDILFVSMNYVNLIKKYSAGEGVTPILTKLGGSEWDKIRERAKNKVKDIARDLIILYAKRKSEEGYSFSGDSHWQKELEASFIFEDTPDQYKSTLDVKFDMESPNPMDRLICGDVGFGKTEVAVRAAFKAVLDNKQVAILVPTTILAVQHYNTFRDRLSSYAVEVECITRLDSKKRQKEILSRLIEGKVNIIIGTHRILSKDIKFKDIGLLIIDEEQRFGVKAKEKLRAIKPNVDTLTLTATPIPRTLNFSLLGARDLSIINTPPKNRKSIITEIINLDWKLISDIIKKELSRDGQVYFVNDKISDLYNLADKIKSLVPKSKIGIAHGQMDGNELEDIVVNFIEKKLNVLLCTKIIESGLDIPNVNTIIINNANMYGLSELYQLRGRVGRSDVQAYAYFVSPPVGKLTKTALRRLQAIEEYTDLGSGFNLAMRDMEIRGVGNLLGSQQSGFIAQVGFETYIDIIEEAVAELKENEFKELFADDENLKKISEKIKSTKEISKTVIDSDLNILIPKEYVENDTERLNIYKRIYDVKEISDLTPLKEELKDRFGKPGEEVNNLFQLVELKIIASEIGLEKIIINEKILTLYFPAEKEHKIFESKFFLLMVEKLSLSKSCKYNFINSNEKLIIEIKLDSLNDNERIKELQKILNI